MFSFYRQTLTAFLVFCLSILGIGWIQLPKMQKLLRKEKTVSLADLKKEVQAEKFRLDLLKKLPTFGFDNVMANWTYLNFLLYFGDDEVRERSGYNLSPEYFEYILQKDPKFIHAYLSLSTSTSMYAGMPDRAVNIAARGLKSLSPQVPKKSYFVWRYKGIDELLFLGDSQAAKKSFNSAANWASQNSDPQSQLIAKISRGTANFLKRKPDSKYAQISAWSMVLNNGNDENTQKRAIAAIQALGGEVIPTPEGSYKIKLPRQD
ncbi:MAG: hypothetical protein AAF378_07295 [Cyanobacteria bacterium P01_A01_bin.84]